MRLSELVNRSYAMAVEKGWEDKPRTIREWETLLHGEVSEFSEEVRADHADLWLNRAKSLDKEGRGPYDALFDAGSALMKPEGLAVELADLLIRWGNYGGTLKQDPPGPEVDRELEEIVQSFKAQPEDDRARLIIIYSMDDPMEFAAVLHREISGFGEMVEKGAIGLAGLHFGAILSLVACYFGHRGWDINSVLELKMSYNARREYRHGKVR